MPEFKEKLCSLSEAVSLIKDGTRIHIGGFAVHHHPMAFVHELIRKGVKDLTLVCHSGAVEVDLLVGAGCVKKVEFAYIGLEEFGLAPNFRRAAERGEIELAEYSEHAAFERFRCNARGHSFVPWFDMIGTDLPKYNPDIMEMLSPFDGRLCHIVPAAEPKWVVIHAPMADKYGNVLYFENRQLPSNLDLVATRTTRNVIVTVEEVVDSNLVRRLSHLNLVPRFRTTAIVEVPYGAHPSSCLQVYDNDREHLKMYAQVARDPAEFKKYLDKYVYGVKSHMDYLKLIGIERLTKLRHVGGNL